MKLQRVPKVGEKFHFFEDGKSGPSRHYIVKIVDVKKFEDVDDELKERIRDEQETCDWLYAPETDYVITGLVPGDVQYFIRTDDGGWFSIGYITAGRLDIDGSRYRNIKSWWTPENGYIEDYDKLSGLTEEDLEGVIG